MNNGNLNLTPWVTEKFISAAPSAAAQALGALPTHEAVLLLKPLKAESVIACLNPMLPAAAAAILRRLPARQAAHVLSRLALPQAVKVFGAFSQPQREKMKTLLPEHIVAALAGFSAWPQGSAGAQMSGGFLAFRTEAKLTDLIEKLKTLPRKKLPAACLVCAKDGTLKGYIRTAELAFYAPASTAGSVMTEAKALAPQAALTQARELLLQGQPLVPVVDEKGRVLGVVGAEQLPPPQAKKRFGWF